MTRAEAETDVTEAELSLIQKSGAGNRIQSLGFRTDMIVHGFGGIIIDRGDYMVVKTPANPGYFFGNFLLFFRAPNTGSLAKWKLVFRDEFSADPGIKHFTFLWDTPNEAGEICEFEAETFEVNFSTVLTARTVRPPPKLNEAIETRIITTDDEWQEVTALQILCGQEGYQPEEYRAFKKAQMLQYRAMSEAGLGAWFGAFYDGKLVGDLGIYRDGNIGRFQSVETHPEFFRQGICGTLVYRSARYAFEQMGLTDLVMVADAHYHAARIYESVGFTEAMKEYSACWWDGRST
jgi:RimJ/RimL family protein N-acetyltransferase